MENIENKVGIVVVTYNALRWIDRCLNSCLGYQVVVVDNHSTDDTVAHIEQNFPAVEIIPLKKNYGFGYANNVGIKHFLQKNINYVYLLNQDAYLFEDTIATLVATHQAHPEYYILSPLHINTHKELDYNFSKFISENTKLMYDVFTNSLSGVYEVPFVNAAGWLLPKQTLKEVGGFDPVFFHYGEDDNYCQRVRHLNKKIGIVPYAFMIHDREKGNNMSRFSPLLISLKTQMADINRSNPEEIFTRHRNIVLKNIIKSVISFKIRELAKNIRLLKTMYQERKRIYESRQINISSQIFKYLLN